MYNNGVEIEIRVNGRPVRSYNHDGKVFVESREGSEYTISIKNNNWYGILAVPSIDGISTMDGKSATHNSGGYIIKAYQSYEIKGFRKSMDEVGAFKFTKKASGYAASKGDTKNVGIISVAVFKEKTPVWNTYYTYNNVLYSNNNDKIIPDDITYKCLSNVEIGLNNTSFSNGVPCSSYSEPVMGKSLSLCSYVSTTKSAPTKDTFDHSTNWGAKVQDKVISGTFEKDYLLAQFDFYYASKDGLKTLGIEIIPKREVAFPQGFGTFCEPPKNWS